jgi:hypothetical protein
MKVAYLADRRHIRIFSEFRHLHLAFATVARVLRSARLRRRLAWCAALAALAVAAAGAVVLLPRGERETVSAATTPDWAPVREEHPVRLAPADRRAINATIGRFVRDAVGRRDLASAWELAGPAMRSQQSRAEWLSGNIPVFPYPAGQLGLDAWKPLYSFRDRVGFDVLVQPRPAARVGAIALSVEVRRSRRGWLVDQIYPVASWNAPDEQNWVTGPPDFAAGGFTSEALEAPPFARRRLGAAWLAAPLAGLALLVLVPVGLRLAGRWRRRRRFAAPAGSAGLPPLPRR